MLQRSSVKLAADTIPLRLSARLEDLQYLFFALYFCLAFFLTLLINEGNSKKGNKATKVPKCQVASVLKSVEQSEPLCVFV